MNTKIKKYIIYLIISLAISIQTASFGLTTASRITDREITERLIKLEEGQKAILREIDKRFESIDKRFESMDKRFESMDKRFDQLINIFIGMIAAFAGIVAVTIGFAIWDRRTALRPAIEKTDSITKREEKLEEIIKEFAKVEPKLAKILRSFGML